MALTKVSTAMFDTAAQSSDLNIDANTLFVDVSTNRVGIGTTSPSVPLEVSGQLKAGGITYPTSDGTNGQALVTNGSGVASFATVAPTAGTGVTVSGTTVSIGQAVGTSSNVTFNNLVVAGTLTVNGATNTNSATNTTIEDILIELGTGTSGSPANDAGLVLERGSSDNVFIGWDESADTFTVGTGSFTGASSGNLTITPATAVFGGLTVDTSTLVVDASNNRVGIGNASPDVSLDVGSFTDAVHVPVGTTAQRPTGAAGYFRYNSTLGKFEGYTDAWGEIGGGGSNTFTTNVYTGDGSTTAFTLSQSVSNVNDLIVFIDGVYQVPTAAYTVSGTTLTMTAAPANTRKIVAYSVQSAISGTNLNQNSFTGNGSAVAFTLSIAPVNENNTQVFLDGVYQHKSTYATSGTTLTFDAAPASGVAIEVMIFTQTEINVPVDGTITTAKLAADAVTSAKIADDAVGNDQLASGLTLGGNTTATIATAAQPNITSVGTLSALTISGDLTVDTSTLKVDSSNNRVGIGTATPGNIVEVVGASPIVEINASSGVPELQFSDGGTDEYSIMYDTGANALKFVEGGVGTKFSIADGGAATFYNSLTVNGAINSFVGTNKNLRTLGLTTDNFSNEGVGISFSRTSSDSALMALGVLDTDKLSLLSRNGIIFATGGSSLYSQTSEVMRIDSNGKVGIAAGGVRYASRLSVGKPTNHTPGSVFTSSPSSFFSEATLGGTTGDTQKIAIFGGSDATNVSGLSIYRYRRATGTNWLTDGFSLRQEVDSSASVYDYINFAGGKVGIGTATPQKTFHVEHTGGASEGILISGASDTDGHTAGILLRAEGGEADSALRAKGGIFFERTGLYGVGKLHLAVDAGSDNTSATISDARVTIDDKGPSIGTGEAVGTFAYNVMMNKSSGGTSGAPHDSSHNAAATVSSLSAPMEFFKTVALINTRAYTSYVNIKTNLTGNSIMFLAHFLGYQYNYGNKEAFAGGYTFTSNSIIAKSNNSTLTGSNTAFTVDSYRASDGALCFKLYVNHTGYTEGQTIFRFHSHSHTTTRQCTVVAVQIRNDGTNHFA